MRLTNRAGAWLRRSHPGAYISHRRRSRHRPAVSEPEQHWKNMKPGVGMDRDKESEALDAYSRVLIAVAERVLPSVASLRVRMNRGEGAGSASVFTDDGFLLTSAHVVE